MEKNSMISKLALKMAGGVAFAAMFVAVVPVTSHLAGDLLLGATTVKAQEHDGGGGQGGKGGQGSGQGNKGGEGGQGSGHSSGEASGAGQGSGGGGVSGADLGRLNMARAFLSPGFDPSKIDDPEAPLMQIIAYKDAMAANDENAAAQALANAATAPISATTVEKLNSLLGISYSLTDLSISEFAELAQSLNKNEEE